MMLRRLSQSVTKLTLVLWLSVGLQAATACSDSSEPTGGNDASTADTGTGGPKDSGGGGTDAGVDAAEAGPLNACATFLDRSGSSASRTLTWDFSISASDERCMKIKAGQTVTFGDGQGGVANFTTHPVGAKGGDTPNPVSELDTTTGEVTFPSAGTFGFECTNHPAMLGVFSVVP